MAIKNPAGLILAGFAKVVWVKLPAVAFLTGRGQPFSPQGLPRFSAAEFARLLIALLEFEPLEQTVILNLLLQNPHGLFDVIIIDLDRYFLQISRPLLVQRIGFA